ncbi:DUF1062 domain-containing protein [Mesorhizobium sp. B4-1-1]|uniref:DUF1062 domain-containing protein n=1 Tax=Mesorhizobium sp. B4-1-1 TaxID=2589890 RepID=UPI001FEF5C67|nr:DUF1062 domain-containing protein [Mesorhizobium sp. B4-1-1]
MSTLRVHWTIAPVTAPRPLINCNRCTGLKAYQCSEKFRVNANGKRIDVWLIYRCVDCDNCWNFAILERRNRRDIEPALLTAFESNDPAFVRRHAFDAAALRDRAGRIEESPDVTVRKELLDGEPGRAVALALELRLDGTTPLRLDRRRRIRSFAVKASGPGRPKATDHRTGWRQSLAQAGSRRPGGARRSGRGGGLPRYPVGRVPLKRKEAASAPSLNFVCKAYAAPITLAAFSKRLRSFGSR